MTRVLLAFGLSAGLLISAVHSLDLPVRLNFQLGFNITVLPAPDDASGELGLVVTADKIVSDKIHSLAVAGTIYNFSDIPREGVTMRFAVTSYIGTGVSVGRAVVEPNCIPPGGAAAYHALIPLDSEKPRLAMYTVAADASAEHVGETGGEVAEHPVQVADSP